MRVKLSETMTDCLDLAKANGGELIRYQGGFWAARDAPTIMALIDRGLADYSEWKEGRDYRFPIAIKVKESAG